MNIIFESGTTVKMGSKRTIKGSRIIIEDEEITEVGKASELKRKHRRYEKINAKDKVVIPGLVARASFLHPVHQQK